MIKIGDIVNFGNYPTGADNSIQPIQWRVLDIKDGKAFLITEYAVDVVLYNEILDEVTWEECSLRAWLNEKFLNDAFSPEEQAYIQNTDVIADGNPEFYVERDSDTKDKIFLLSISEAGKYFATDEERKCVPTAYAKQWAWIPDEFDSAVPEFLAKGGKFSEITEFLANGGKYSDLSVIGLGTLKDYTILKGYTADGRACCDWWLRNPGEEQVCAAVVLSSGEIECCGFEVNDEDDNQNGVRPACWVDISVL